MITRRSLLVGLGVSSLSPALPAFAQQGGKIPRIGVLWHAGSAEEEKIPLGGLVEGFTNLGYVNGKNIVLEHRFPNEQPDRFVTLAAELVLLKVDVLIAVTRNAALAAQSATTTIPTVFIAVPDPVGIKLIDSLARPGGNITGLALLTVELVTKQLQLLTQAIPKVSHVALLTNPSNPGAALQRRDAETAARALGLQLQVLEAQRLDELAGAFDAMTSQRAEAVLLPGDSVLYFYRKQIADLAIKNRLPALFAPREFAEAGGLMAYGANIADLYRRAATYVDRILKGANPGDLSIEQPTKFELVINLKTAKALGIIIPPLLLQRADEVIH